VRAMIVLRHALAICDNSSLVTVFGLAVLQSAALFCGIGPFRLFRPTFVPFCEHRDLVDCAAGDDVQDFLVGTRKGQVVGIP